MPAHGNKKVVIAALVGNGAIAATKFAAALLTGSSAMLSEGVHSLVDTCNELLLLHGMRRAARPADPAHPFGHGREIYFWSFIVALLVFALGAVASAAQGIAHLRHPEPMERPLVNYLVLGASLVFEGASWWVAMHAFRKAKGDAGWFDAFRASKDASTFTVLFEDTAAILGLLIAFAGVGASHLTGDPKFDAMASLGIAVVLAAASFLLARETKALLLGETAPKLLSDALLRIAADDPAVRCANGVLAIQIGPESVVAALSAEFEDALTTDEIEDCVRRIERAVQREHRDVVALFIKPQTAATWAERAKRLADEDDAPPLLP